ncbi:MAG: YdcF family protein [Bacteroidia bacterium]
MKKSALLFFCPAALLVFTYCNLFNPSAQKLYRRALKKNAAYDAVIVPGVPFIEPSWDRVMQMRVIWAVHLYKRGLTKKIITSGASVYSPYVEARIMKLYAMKLGVPEKDILTEEKAEHSTENIWYGNKLALSHGYTKIALATDPFQTNLMYRFVRRRTPDVAFLPVLFDTLRTLPHDTPVINYSSLKVEKFIALPDRESKWQRFRGTRGKHIKFKE